jgi:hypothetical protein
MSIAGSTAVRYRLAKPGTISVAFRYLDVWPNFSMRWPIA